MIRCKHWSPSIEGHGICAIGYRHLPKISFCQNECIRYQEKDLPVGQHTVDEEKSKVDDFIAAHKKLIKEGRVKKEVADFRLTLCTGTDKEGQMVTLPCIHYTGSTAKRGSGKCTACGCKTWKISEMRLKVYYPMGCPVGRFSEMPGRRIDVNNSSSRPQPEVKDGKGTGLTDEDVES